MPYAKVKDQREVEVRVENKPQRIISLVPSLTELLFHLGLDREIIGLTKFCVHPKNRVRAKTMIGGTKNIKIERIKDLQPDLIIANKEENVKMQVEELEKEFPVYVSDINNMEESYGAMASIGSITGKSEKAESLIKSIKKEFGKLNNWIAPEQNRESVAYFIWKDPYMTVGGDTFINQMLREAGYENIFEKEKRYPVLSEENIKEASPGLIFLSSEPFPFQLKHLEEFKNICPNSHIQIVDGEMFSWYGSRLIKAPGYFKKLFDKIQN